jgi:hypothetical protein
VNDELATRHAAAVTEHLGVPGRMVGLSKAGYRDANPRNLVVFNANVCFRGGKVWWGDVDLTIDEPSLTALAAHTQETVYVLHESDGRFRHEADPLLQRAVYSVTPDGHTRFDAGMSNAPPTDVCTFDRRLGHRGSNGRPARACGDSGSSSSSTTSRQTRPALSGRRSCISDAETDRRGHRCSS